MAEPPGWRLRTRSLSISSTLVMGVVNVTPDSFSDGGQFLQVDDAVAHGHALVRAGADIVDVGGESTRPGAEPVDEDEELRRTLEVVSALASSGVVVSIDTTKARVAAAAVEAGAEIINDVTGGRDPDMVEIMASSGAGVVLMHMRGEPRTMQSDPTYDDVVAEILEYLTDQGDMAMAAGVDRASIAIDPGIGFGKTVAHNLELLRSIPRFVATGFPVLVGASRKAFLGTITGRDELGERDVASAVVTGLAVAAGASVVRVHDVGASLQAVRISQAVYRGWPATDLTQ